MFNFFNKNKKKKIIDNDNKNIWIVVGLGNPGPEYADTRHNCGFKVIDKLIEKIGYNERQIQKFKGKYVSCNYEENKIILLKPETYMNNSGESVDEAMNWFKVDESHLIVIYDDFDISVGQIRVRPKGSAGTHNGMKSIIQYVASDEFSRIRVGIGPKDANMDIIKFVLGKFSVEDSKILDDSFSNAANAVLCIIKDGVENAMNKYNGKIKK